LKKKAVYGSQRVSSESDSEKSYPSVEEIGSMNDEGQSRKKKKLSVWNKPMFDEIKIIDFGGATYENEHHT